MILVDLENQMFRKGSLSYEKSKGIPNIPSVPKTPNIPKISKIPETPKVTSQVQTMPTNDG